MEFALDAIMEAVLWVKTKQCRFCGIIATESMHVVHGERCESENVAKALRQLLDGRNSDMIIRSNNNAVVECVAPPKRKRTITPEGLAVWRINIEKARRARMAKLAAQKQELRKTWNTEVL